MAAHYKGKLTQQYKNNTKKTEQLMFTNNLVAPYIIDLHSFIAYSTSVKRLSTQTIILSPRSNKQTNKNITCNTLHSPLLIVAPFLPTLQQLTGLSFLNTQDLVKQA
ncbi:hypothetical protein V6Z11_A08G064000 [Gossypium hirsutum]